MEYVVVTSHCHYDHILGVEQFNDSPILASSRYPSFVDPSNLPENSLCNECNVETPSYTPTLVPNMHEIIAKSSDGTQIPLGMLVLHTPGHTPDELALYDTREMMLYVGDTAYENERIIFPKEGSIVDWFASMDFLISFVEAKELSGVPQRGPSPLANCVLINAGHRTALRPALEVLQGARAFVQNVINGIERVRLRYQFRGEETVVYQQDDGIFSLGSPERLVLEAGRVLGER
ncbi:beta-lactamase-like protein [Infundibulicybe gibba]|nr:beta-lactamase-like protein [Infundibulicybe gibba]